MSGLNRRENYTSSQLQDLDYDVQELHASLVAGGRAASQVLDQFKHDLEECDAAGHMDRRDPASTTQHTQPSTKSDYPPS